MKKLTWAAFFLVSLTSFGKTSTIECINAHAASSKIKLELLSGEAARATIQDGKKSRNELLEVVSKSRDGIFFKTEKGSLLKLASVDNSIELSQVANAFDVNYESATCRI
ncbi:hypothetical protein [Halobacteriovorax sp.]|uniref:hypothetical protein n=1 Tax=Halobacteriovorax sp. TaxID=2020862 RepID=UPI00356415B8